MTTQGEPYDFTLAEFNFAPKAVYEGKKVGMEQRWFAAERLEEALKAIQA